MCTSTPAHVSTASAFSTARRVSSLSKAIVLRICRRIPLASGLISVQSYFCFLCKTLSTTLGVAFFTWLILTRLSVISNSQNWLSDVDIYPLPRSQSTNATSTWGSWNSQCPSLSSSASQPGNGHELKLLDMEDNLRCIRLANKINCGRSKSMRRIWRN